jgi:Recombination endonuclease VII
MGWNKERYANDAEYRERFLARQRARRLANRDELNARRWGQDLQRLYGISQADYDALLAKQGGRCAICRKLPKNERLCVDHCHLTGMIRGLLCRQCNFGLGSLGEDQRALVAALAYLGARSDDSAGSAAQRALLVRAALPPPPKRAILTEAPLRAWLDATSRAREAGRARSDPSPSSAPGR